MENRHFDDARFCINCWNEAYELWHALEQLAPDDIREAVTREIYLDDLLVSGGPAPTTAIDEPFDLDAFVASIGEKPSNHGHYLNQAKEHLITGVKQGKLICFGYLAPMKHGDLPIQLQPDCLTGVVDWREGSIRNPQRAINVRIIGSSRVIDAWESFAQLEENQTRRGPAPGAPQIFAVYTELRDTGQINWKSLRSNQPTIRDRLCERFPEGNYERGPNGKGRPGDRVIENVLAEQFKMDRIEHLETLGPTKGRA